MDNISISIVLDSKPLKSGLHSVYIRFIKDRKTKRISLGIQVKKEHFKNGRLLRGHVNYKADNAFLIEIESKAHEVYRQLRIEQPSFTIADLVSKLKGKPSAAEMGIIKLINAITTNLKAEGRMGYAKVYKDTAKSLELFSGGDINLRDVNPSFLESYEAFLRNRGNRNSSIAVKMRQIRRAVYKAIEDGILDESKNPFRTYKVSKLKGSPRKIALGIDQLKKFVEVDLSDHPDLIEAYDYFLFSFYTRGMNFFDMMKLKKSDIKSGRINYIRSKTKVSYSVDLNDEARKIIDKYKDINDTEYVFPIMSRPNMTPQQIENRRHKVIGRVNQKLKRIANLAGIEENITFYVARHSFATNLRFAGISPDRISELMGHQDVKVTMGYLKEFDFKDLDQDTEQLFKLL